jgi:hypothetical protein
MIETQNRDIEELDRVIERASPDTEQKQQSIADLQLKLKNERVEEKENEMVSHDTEQE